MENSTYTDIKLMLAAVLAAVTAWLGSLAIPVYTLVGLNIADYVTGLLAAPKRGERISSQKGMNGIVKKCLQYILVYVGTRMDWLVGFSATSLGFAIPTPSIVGLLVCVWLIVNEMFSILENLADAGVATPPFLAPLIEAIRKQTEAAGAAATGDKDDDGERG